MFLIYDFALDFLNLSNFFNSGWGGGGFTESMAVRGIGAYTYIYMMAVKGVEAGLGLTCDWVSKFLHKSVGVLSISSRAGRFYPHQLRDKAIGAFVLTL